MAGGLAGGWRSIADQGVTITPAADRFHPCIGTSAMTPRASTGAPSPLWP